MAYMSTLYNWKLAVKSNRKYAKKKKEKIHTQHIAQHIISNASCHGTECSGFEIRVWLAFAIVNHDQRADQ